MINPYHIQPGLILDVDITSIKRKKATLDGMANVLNEFLFGVSKGFADAAFAAFSRRRSTVREDIAQSFAATPPTGEEGAGRAVRRDAAAGRTRGQGSGAAPRWPRPGHRGRHPQGQGPAGPGLQGQGPRFRRPERDLIPLR